MAVLSLVFATISVYRLNYFLTLIIVIVTLHQVFAKENTMNFAVDAENHITYDNIKLKLN